MAEKESVDNKLPIDEGKEAFNQRIVDNPYPDSSWKQNEWQLGWDFSEQASPDLFDHKKDRFLTKTELNN